MGTANVSIESLNNAKSALSRFATDIQTVIDSINSHSREAVDEIRRKITAQEKTVAALDAHVRQLGKEIGSYEQMLVHLRNKATVLSANIAACSKELAQLKAELDGQLQQKRSLDAGASAEEKERALAAINSRIEATCSRIRQATEQKDGYVSELNDTNEHKEKVRQSKSACEQERTKARGELNKAKNKEQQLKSAGSAATSEIETLQDKLKTFNREVLSTTAGGNKGLQQCLAALEEYSAIGL